MSLKITRGSGFHIQFDNGWTASVQFGQGNYCEHHDDWDSDIQPKPIIWESYNAEIAAWPKNGEMVSFANGNTVEGWVRANDVLLFLNWVAGDDHSNPPRNLRS